MFGFLRPIASKVRLRLWLLPQMHLRYRSKPAADVFREIYQRQLWGTNGELFFSGAGSTGSWADRYIQFVVSFIQTKRISTVVDLGCGDFRIGQRIANSGVDYVGLDVVLNAAGITATCWLLSIIRSR